MEYLLKVSLVLGIGYGFYKAVLQQESFFGLNRLYLLAALVLAFALPLVTLPKLVQHQGLLASAWQRFTRAAPAPSAAGRQALPEPLSAPAASLQTDAEAAPQASEPVLSAAAPDHKLAAAAPVPATDSSPRWSWALLLALLYGFGVSVFSLHLLLQALQLMRKAARSAERVADEGALIVHTATTQAPCSFFHYIFLYPDAYDFATYEQIIAHEKIHVRQGHTWDLLLAELALVVLWFNPVAWLYRREVEKNLEYQTDALLLGTTQVPPAQYQLSLLQIACPQRAVRLATNYNQSLLKQRILMMNAKRSTPQACWKYAFLAPLFFGTLLLLNAPASSQQLKAGKLAAEPYLPHPAASAPRQVPAELYALASEPAAAPEPRSAAAAALQQGEQPQLKGRNAKAARKEKETAKRAPAAPAPQVVAPAPQVAPPAPELPDDAREARSRSRRGRNFTGGSTDMSEGYWYSFARGNEYCLELKGSRTGSSWNINECMAKSQFLKKGADQFELTRDAGTLTLSGKLDEEVSQGKYRFAENAGFRDFLQKQNLSGTSENLLFHLFLADFDRKYVTYLKAQYPDLEAGQLLTLAVHGIGQQELQRYLTLFQQHGNRKPDLPDIISARIHGIDEAYVQELESAGYKGLPLDQLMTARIHGVRKSYIEGLRQEGFTNLPLDKVIEAKIHGLSPAAIKDLKAMGFGELSLDRMMELRIHRVNAEFMQGLASAGFKNLSAEKAIEARIHGVTGDFIRSASEDGYNLKTLDEYINIRIMGLYRKRHRD